MCTPNSVIILIYFVGIFKNPDKQRNLISFNYPQTILIIYVLHYPILNPYFADITTEGLLMALPFENKLQSFELKGKHLLEALEYSVSAEQTNPNSFYSYRMLQIGGKTDRAFKYAEKQ